MIVAWLWGKDTRNGSEASLRHNREADILHIDVYGKERASPNPSIKSIEVIEVYFYCKVLRNLLISHATSLVL
jgi:hypothetical protein